MPKNEEVTLHRTPREGLAVYLKYKGARIISQIEDKTIFPSSNGIERKKPKMYYCCTFETSEELKGAMQSFYEDGGKEIEDAMDYLRRMRIKVWKDYKENNNVEKE